MNPRDAPEERQPLNAIPDGEVDLELFLREIEVVLGEDAEDNGGEEMESDGGEETEGDGGDGGDAGVVDDAEVDADQNLPNGHSQ
ncbi:hypothetical protein DFQ27_000299 [Actinomortierella ambigua]|uniref:Uncharacterized protein n=1 Tax=Actinomortierella ambigua TaxID=1343610 RepID=A0A9P6PL34_9FUNG|nr:hypothetical protein DFQ27_000299 [Actinomortierella ambigua]